MYEYYIITLSSQDIIRFKQRPTNAWLSITND